MNDHTCQSCGWCQDFGTFGFCDNTEAKGKYPDNKLTYEDLVTDNKCEFFDNDTWFGG